MMFVGIDDGILNTGLVEITGMNLTIIAQLNFNGSNPTTGTYFQYLTVALVTNQFQEIFRQPCRAQKNHRGEDLFHDQILPFLSLKLKCPCMLMNLLILFDLTVCSLNYLLVHDYLV